MPNDQTTARESERRAILSSVESDAQIGVPITSPRRAGWVEHIKRAVEQAADARSRGDARRAAEHLASARLWRMAIADAPVMCAIGDGRIIDGPMGQHPPQPWRDAYLAEQRQRRGVQ